jgi:hypothetical protein
VDFRRTTLAAAGHDPPMALELINVMFSRLWAGRCGKPDHWPHLQRMPARSAGGSAADLFDLLRAHG